MQNALAPEVTRETIRNRVPWKPLRDWSAPPPRVRIALASSAEREVIYRLRHEVYARELGQHGENAEAKLTDTLDGFNQYMVASVNGEVAGFIAITPPGGGSYSLDKYLARERLPFAFDENLYEIRLLTVMKPSRGRQLAALLMYAAFRWVEAHGGTRIMAIGRTEILEMYLKAGLQPVGYTIRSGAVTYEVLQTTTRGLREHANQQPALLEKLERDTDWQLAVPFCQPAPCFHGGAFFAAIGETFDSLERIRSIINADVLDAWFPPSPKVMTALQEYLPWLLRTSPPTGGEGLVQTIARVRGVAANCVLTGAGSSALIFLAFRQWLSRDSRVLILDPTYGEYAHVLERVVRCQVDRLTLARETGYQFDLDELERFAARRYDLIVLVNPNSPTGRMVPRAELERILARVPATTRVWVDEAYVDYVGREQSLEGFAARSENVVVCKTLSKVYALSGARAAYLCAGPHQLEELRAITPPWAVGLLAQVAAVKALEDPDYYAARYRETQMLREQLSAGLRALGMEIIPGSANFILCHLPANELDAGTVVQRCREQGLFLRDTSAMGTRLERSALRIAVKDGTTNERMIEILGEVIRDGDRRETSTAS